MPVTLHGATKVWQRRDRRTQFTIWGLWLLAAAGFAYCSAFVSEKTIWPFVLDAPAQAVDLGVRMVPPDWGFIGTLWKPMNFSKKSSSMISWKLRDTAMNPRQR